MTRVPAIRVRIWERAFVVVAAVGMLSLGATLSASAPSADSHGPAIPTSGLIAHWPLNGNAIDVTGHGHNGTIVGAASTAGVNGGAYHFNGSAHIDAGVIAFPTSTFSVSLW